MEETDQKKLVRLIREIAKEEAWQAIYLHVEEYKHGRKVSERHGE